MLFPETLWLALLALVCEASIGYPTALYRVIGHPVSWIGRLIGYLDRALNRPNRSYEDRQARGIVALGLVIFIAFFIPFFIDQRLPEGLLRLAVEAFLGSSLIAQRSLYAHVKAVSDALEVSLDLARREVANIVGRDVSALDSAGVARAAIESLAENFSDGVVAPVFWMAFLGLPGASVYKAINTADSMIGYRNVKYLAFGSAAAKCDDWANFLPARLSAVYLTLAAFITPHASGVEAWRIFLRDGRKHPSPNSGCPEAAMAGAVNVRLGGPRIYGDKVVNADWMGDGAPLATKAQLLTALTLYQRALYLQFVTLAIVAYLLI